MSSVVYRSFKDLGWNLFPFDEIPDRQFSKLMLAAKQGDSEVIKQCLLQTSDLTQPCVQDAFLFAAMKGHANIIELMLDMGIDPNPTKCFDVFKDPWDEHLTALGHAINKRHFAVTDLLLNSGMDINNVSRLERNPEKALDLFFSESQKLGSDTDMLRLILSRGAIVHSLNRDTIFNIGIYSNAQELTILINAGFDPKSVFMESRAELEQPGKTLFYTLGLNLLDLAVMQAEKANIFREDTDSIEKVRLLLQKGANPSTHSRCHGQTYLHQVSQPELIKLFAQAGIDVRAKAAIDNFSKDEVSPIEIMHTEGAIELLCAFGEDRENAPFLKGTRAHKQALDRIGYNPDIEKGGLLLRKAADNYDIGAFVALIGEGIDINQSSKGGWTCLHKLFSEIFHGFVSDTYDYTTIAEDFKIRLINMLIQHGAAPLKDLRGQTPLMCVNDHPHNLSFNSKLYEMYLDFEANYYNLNPQEYREKFRKLIKSGRVGYIDEFWKSFTNHSDFAPPKTYDPIYDWNRERSLVEGH